jgi:hypothetical protein
MIGGDSTGVKTSKAKGSKNSAMAGDKNGGGPNSIPFERERENEELKSLRKRGRIAKGLESEEEEDEFSGEDSDEEEDGEGSSGSEEEEAGSEYGRKRANKRQKIAENKGKTLKRNSSLIQEEELPKVEARPNESGSEDEYVS